MMAYITRITELRKAMDKYNGECIIITERSIETDKEVFAKMLYESNVLDTISKDHVNLKYFGWQEGKPINYHTLKYVIFQNEYQQNLGDNIDQKREAEDILSQEYVIALQPSSLYQLWTLKRLIMKW